MSAFNTVILIIMMLLFAWGLDRVLENQQTICESISTCDAELITGVPSDD